ncbi:hypothetical protein RJ641_029794 [Dillenia turbinata]|uniref:Uncharacterized protein n=1 Tax=Dillenia turbinata TaxID=194707 RepID=A0AAN8ZN15_9MAGN
MALAFTNLSWWLWSGIKYQENKIPGSSTSLNSSQELGLWDSEPSKFSAVKRGNMPSSRKVKRKWHSREERKIEREYDVVVVPSDGVCFSGSESEDSDWSIGWMEPHAPGFLSSDDDESESSFAVLVPCYGLGNGVMEEVRKNIILETIRLKTPWKSGYLLCKTSEIQGQWFLRFIPVGLVNPVSSVKMDLSKESFGHWLIQCCETSVISGEEKMAKDRNDMALMLEESFSTAVQNELRRLLCDSTCHKSHV